MHVPLSRRHDRRRVPVRLFRAPPPPLTYDEASATAARGMNRVAILILAGFFGTLLLIQLLAWATGAPGVAVMFGGL